MVRRRDHQGVERCSAELSYLKGLDLPRHLDGHEAKNIDHIVDEIARRLSPKLLHVATYPIGLPSRAEQVVSLMANELKEIRIVGIYGMGGIGKSAIAKEQLLSEIYERKHEKIDNPEIGLHLIVEKLCRTRVLLVLDDVDELECVNNIIGNCEWLLPGSRVIITTRLKDLLNSSRLYFQHEVHHMNNNDSLRLLSLHAFGQNHPAEDYLECVRKMVQYCCGIPLAIEVLGSSLSGQSMSVWKSRLEKLKVIANDDIHSKLKTSYDSLDETVQFLFLDIACFFIGYHQENIIKILDGCGFFPVQGISALVRRCLLTIGSNGKLAMHDLLRDMGREIVCQENAMDPGERSRLWHHKDVIDVLTDKMGTNAVEGLVLNKQGLRQTWSTKTFKKMKMIRLLQLNYVGLTGNYEHISKKLRWLCWRQFPLESIPFDLSFENMIVLDMRYSGLKVFAGSGKSFMKLKVLNLSHSLELTEVPDLEGCQNLEKLILKDCIRLDKVGNSIGLLFNLVLLNFQDCKSLECVPQSIGGLRALEKLNMSGCSKLASVPDTIGSLVQLTFLSFENCGNLQMLPGTIGGLKSLKELALSRCFKLEVLPESIQFLSSLVSLNLQNCESLKSLPRSIGHLRSLESLEMSGCSHLESLPESAGHFSSLLFWNLQDCKNLRNFPTEIRGLKSLQKLSLSGCSKLVALSELGNLTSLISLNLDETGLVFLPERIKNMKRLEILSVRECPLIFSSGNNSRVISHLPYSLRKLDLRYCNILDGVIPDDLGGLHSLKELKLCGNKFTHLPDSLGGLVNLDKLYLNACKELRSIPQLPRSVSGLEAEDCASLETIDLTKFPADKNLNLSGCVNLKELRGYFNLEPLEVETAETLVGSSSIRDSIRKFSVRKIVCQALGTTMCPLQALYERGIYSIFLPGGDVPAWFSHQNEGNTVSLKVPEIKASSRNIGVVTYATYSWRGTSSSCFCVPLVVITNKTKMFDWVHQPNVTFFSSDVEQDISWMCYWIFEYHDTDDRTDSGWLFKGKTEQGDELEFSIDMGLGIGVKNCGIHLLCETGHSDELAAISYAASRHHKRFASTLPLLLMLNSQGQMNCQRQVPPNEELTEWGKQRSKKLEETSFMRSRVEPQFLRLRD